MPTSTPIILYICRNNSDNIKYVGVFTHKWIYAKRIDDAYEFPVFLQIRRQLTKVTSLVCYYDDEGHHSHIQLFNLEDKALEFSKKIFPMIKKNTSDIDISNIRKALETKNYADKFVRFDIDINDVEKVLPIEYHADKFIRFDILQKNTSEIDVNDIEKVLLTKFYEDENIKFDKEEDGKIEEHWVRNFVDEELQRLNTLGYNVFSV